MSIEIEISDTVGFKVKGSYNNSKGQPVAFDFQLECERLEQDDLQAAINDQGNTLLIDFMLGINKGWTGVKDKEGKPVPYSEEAFRKLCRIPGMARTAFQAYLGEVGVKEKN